MQSKSFEVEIDGHLFTGECDYEPSEPETDIDPPIPAMVTVYTLFLNGGLKECYEFINPATIQRIESYLVEQYS